MSGAALKDDEVCDEVESIGDTERGCSGSNDNDKGAKLLSDKEAALMSK